MPKKKIAFVVAIPMTAQAFLMDHFRVLQNDFEIHLIANFPNKESMEIFIQQNIICHDIKIQRDIRLGKDIKSLLNLYHLFKKEKFSSVHSVTPKAGLLTSIAAFLSHIKVRIHIFTGQVWATKKGAMRLLLKAMDKMIANLDTNILVDGESQRQFLIKEGVLSVKKSKVLADGSISGVKIERFAISAEVRERERRKFDFKRNDVVYIFLGRLNHDKGIGELYEAFNNLVIDSPNAKLLFYGMDEEHYIDRVKDFANIRLNENFFFPGLTNIPYEALQAGDVFVLPTWREGFGSSVIEAQALGLPVITSDAYGVLDASVENETGLRCKVGDSETLYKCMKCYYEHPKMREQHGNAGRKRVEEKFNNDVVSAAWSQYYKQILE